MSEISKESFLKVHASWMRANDTVTKIESKAKQAERMSWWQVWKIISIIREILKLIQDWKKSNE